MNRNVELKFCAAALIATGLVFGCFVAAGWPGALHECVAAADCYCEARRTGAIAQPANTWSAMTFAICGLVLARRSGRRRAAAASPPYLRAPWVLHTTLLTVAVCLLAPGAMFFHASLTDWGGIVDIGSMYLCLAFWLAANLQLALGWSNRFFVCFYAASVAILTAPRSLSSSFGVPLVSAVIVAAVVTDWLPVRTGSEAHRLVPGRKWLWLGLGFFSLARLAELGLPCHPRSYLQGHALLHLLHALVMACLYAHLWGKWQSIGGKGQ
jgi:hypothetical protein